MLILVLPSAWLYYLKQAFALGLGFLICIMRGLDEMTSKVPSDSERSISMTQIFAKAARRDGEARS